MKKSETKMTLLEKVIAAKIVLGCDDRQDALLGIRKSIEIDGLYQFAKTYRVLVDNSAEDFAIEFMSAFNDEVFVAY